MLLILLLGVGSCCLSLVFTPLVAHLSARLGLVDLPDDSRKFHKGLISRLGGVAIAAAYLLTLQAFRIPFIGRNAGMWNALSLTRQLLPGAILVFLVGLYDDIHGLKPLQKISIEILAAITVYSLGVRIVVVDNQVTGTTWSFLITILWLLLCTNAINLIDGLDGLATGVGICASVVTMIAALGRGNTPLALVSVPLVGSLVGFLRYNFAPAKIFLGDCGSLTIGFLLGCYGVLWGQKSATLVGMIAPVLALSIPLLDTSISVFRRYLGGRPLFRGDRGHIHHKLLDRGFTPVRAALLLYVACTGCAIAAVCMEVSKFRLMTLLTFGALTVIGMRYLDYAEFSAAASILRKGAVLRLVRSEILLQAFEREFEAARTPDECWNVLKRFYRPLGFCDVTCYIAGRVYNDGTLNDGTTWSLRIPLLYRDYVEFQRDPDGSKSQQNVDGLIFAVRETLVRKMVWSSWAQLETDLLKTPGTPAWTRRALAAGSSTL